MNELLDAIRDLDSATELYLKAEKKYEEEKMHIVLNDSVYGAAKNAEVRNAYLADKLKIEMIVLEKAAAEKRRCTVVKEMAEVCWKSEKYDIMLKVGKLD